jgi:hypothetical protein
VETIRGYEAGTGQADDVRELTVEEEIARTSTA